MAYSMGERRSITIDLVECFDLTGKHGLYLYYARERDRELSLDGCISAAGVNLEALKFVHY